MMLDSYRTPHHSCQRQIALAISLRFCYPKRGML